MPLVSLLVEILAEQSPKLVLSGRYVVELVRRVEGSPELEPLGVPSTVELAADELTQLRFDAGR